MLFALIYMDNSEIWHDVLETIKVSVSSAIYSTWFSKTHISSLVEIGERSIIEVGCPTAFTKNTIESRYFGLIQDSLNKVVSKKCDVTFIVKENPQKTSAETEVESPLFESKKDDRNFVDVLRNAKIKQTFTF